MNTLRKEHLQIKFLIIGSKEIEILYWQTYEEID